MSCPSFMTRISQQDTEIDMTKSYSGFVPTTCRRQFVIRADRLRLMPYDTEGGGNTYYKRRKRYG